ncbi:MAG: polymorphic toxin type 44 domain-containing protein [Clostridia bacterium]|jgi:hypothetical protein|nr:polymorphic toxin type 44 domain-containing protein [Clostridia bacterium]MCI2000679.1 polymorphic toxin type 44 domain-containing protein [Clostridia bacterium]MCI2015248.1 polymorphic toxin type 44 domain-containing protein [Clostridia bacterium]
MGKLDKRNDILVAKELKDISGYILGSSEYFRHMNENSVLGFLTSDKTNYDYGQMFKNSNAKLCIEIKKILLDLERNAEYISFVSSSKRERLKKFIEGLYTFSGYVGYPCTDCNKCISFLTLYDSKSRRCSNASDSDIDKAVHVMYNGGKSNVYSSDRFSLVEKAYKSGVSWTAGNDKNKKAYLNEVMGKHNEKFLGDAFHKYIFKYKLREKIIGQNGKDMFSDDYINDHEKQIFGTPLLSRYMSSHPFDYVKFYKDKLNEIEKKINSDFDRGARGSQFVKYINWKRLQLTSEILKKLGIDTTYFNINLKRFELVDVTEKLINIFREAKRDGEALKAKYPLSLTNKSRHFALPAIEDEQTIALFWEFKNLVESGAKYDIKRRCSWIRDLQYIFDGYIIDYDDAGNMAYGVIATAAGMSKVVLHGGAGIYNAFELFKNSKGHDERLQSLKVDLDRISSLGDDPRDYRAIELGIKYYYKI